MEVLQKEPIATDSQDWDYRAVNTKEYTHGIHPYPAMMIPHVARRLIQSYGRDGGVLFDPYCGTGTTLLEGMLSGLASSGTDLNPLARLIARTKTTPVDLESLDAAIADFMRCRSDAGASNPDTPDIPNIDYWFSKRAQRDLTLTLDYIKRIKPEPIADFFRVAFSLTVRKVSWTKNSEFKLVRMAPEQMDRHSPDVFMVMAEVLSENRKAFQSLRDARGDDPLMPTVFEFNSVSGIPEHAVAPGSVDLVVTSPPYGDSRTTVAYGQFSRLSSQWLGYKDANRIDNALMGGTKLGTGLVFGVDELDDVIHDISLADVRRARDVASFFYDYRESIRNVSTTIKPGGYACYVVGNRTVKGYEVPTAELTATFFEMNGFTRVNTFQRNIPNKRMPSMNSPSNVPGKLGKTMKSENIVICRKTC